MVQGMKIHTSSQGHPTTVKYLFGEANIALKNAQNL